MLTLCAPSAYAYPQPRKAFPGIGVERKNDGTRLARARLDEPVPHPADVLTEQHSAELLEPRWGSSSARMIVSRSGIVSASTFVIRP